MYPHLPAFRRHAIHSCLLLCCRIRLDTTQPRDSDKYNGSLLESPVHGSKSSQSSGYGLGSSAFSQFGGLSGLESRGLGASYSPARSSFSEEALGSQESTTSTAFLEPFGGADNVKFYPPPSPLKPQAAQDVSTTQHSCMPTQGCCSTPVLLHRDQKHPGSCSLHISMILQL